MKTPTHYIQFDQSYLQYKRERKAKQERFHMLAFAAFLAITGAGSVWLCLTLAAKVM